MRRVFIFVLSCVCKDGLWGKKHWCQPEGTPAYSQRRLFQFQLSLDCQAQSRCLLMPPENTWALTAEHSYPSTCMLALRLQNTPLFVFISEHLTIRHTRWSGATVLGFSLISLLSLCCKQTKCRHINQKLKRKKKTKTNRANQCISLWCF